MIRKKGYNKSRLVIDLTGPDGNAFVLMGYGVQFAKQLGLDWEPIQNEMMHGSYEQLVEVFDKYFGSLVILEY